MAIVKVTQKTFSKLMSENIDKMGGLDLLTASLLGGSDKLKETIANTPDENVLLVNTDHVVAVSGLIRVRETGETIFRIYFTHPDDKGNAINIKGEDYERFVLAWSGEERYLYDGEYVVQIGYRAVCCNDGRKVKVEKKEEADTVNAESVE